MVDGLTEVCNGCVIGIRSPCVHLLSSVRHLCCMTGHSGSEASSLFCKSLPSRVLPYIPRSTSCKGGPPDSHGIPDSRTQITIPTQAGFPLFLRAPLSASGLIRTGWSDREKSSAGPCPCLLVLFLHPRRRPGVLPPKIVLPVERRGRRTLSWIVHGAILQNYQVSAVGHHGVEAGLGLEGARCGRAPSWRHRTVTPSFVRSRRCP